MDMIPGISQCKSLFQVICGDEKGAIETQKNFLKTCPGVSQATSVVQLIGGNKKGAIETQKAFLKTTNAVVNGIPVVGHVKGAVHLVCGDEEQGLEAFKSSTRTLGVIGGGVGGCIVGGPAGAVVGGIGAGAAMDGLYTGVKNKPNGCIKTFKDIIETDENPSGKIFDFYGGIALDGFTGYQAGKMVLNETLIEDKPVVSDLDPNDVKYSQTYVNKDRLGNITESIKSEGWNGDPVDVVDLRSDGFGYVSLDNRRLHACRTTNTPIKCNVHKPNALLPEGFNEARNFPPEVKTWTHAVEYRYGKQPFNQPNSIGSNWSYVKGTFKDCDKYFKQQDFKFIEL